MCGDTRHRPFPPLHPTRKTIWGETMSRGTPTARSQLLQPLPPAEQPREPANLAFCGPCGCSTTSHGVKQRYRTIPKEEQLPNTNKQHPNWQTRWASTFWPHTAFSKLWAAWRICLARCSTSSGGSTGAFFCTGLSLALAGPLLRRDACLWADASRAGPVDRELQLRHVAALHRFEQSSFGSSSFQRF